MMAQMNMKSDQRADKEYPLHTSGSPKAKSLHDWIEACRMPLPNDAQTQQAKRSPKNVQGPWIPYSFTAPKR